VRMLKALGFAQIIIADLAADKRAAALEAGATAAIDNGADDALAQISAAGSGLLQAAFDFVNIGPTVALALETLGKQGKLVLIGVGGGELPLSLASLIFRPRAIMGTITGRRQDLRDVIALAQSGKFVPLPVTLMPKDSANEALALLGAGKVIGRIVLTEGMTHE
jgi:alcohol dehydrogenase, propanol-preferring